MKGLKKLSRRLNQRLHALNVAWEHYQSEVLIECRKSAVPPDPRFGNLPELWDNFLKNLIDAGYAGRRIIDEFRTAPENTDAFQRACHMSLDWFTENIENPKVASVCPAICSFFDGSYLQASAEGPASNPDYWAVIAIRHILYSPELPERPAPLDVLLVAFLCEVKILRDDELKTEALLN